METRTACEPHWHRIEDHSRRLHQVMRWSRHWSRQLCFPQVAYVKAPCSKKTKNPCSPENLKLEIRDPRGVESEPQSASVHPSSVRGRLNGSHWPSPYCCFHEKVRTTKVYVRDATPTPPLAPFLLTGNNLEGETTLVLDGWLKCVVEGGQSSGTSATSCRERCRTCSAGKI